MLPKQILYRLNHTPTGPGGLVGRLLVQRNASECESLSCPIGGVRRRVNSPRDSNTARELDRDQRLEPIFRGAGPSGG
jgi:hypothetical protein